MKQMVKQYRARAVALLAIAAALFGLAAIDPALAMAAGMALTTTSGLLSNGTILQISSGSPTSFVTVNNARNIEFDNGTSAKVDMTNLTSDWKEFLMGLPDPGSLTFELDVNLTETGHQIMRAARVSRVKCDFKVILPTGFATPNALMQGFVAKFPITVGAHDTAIKTQVECYLTGPITFS